MVTTFFAPMIVNILGAKCALFIGTLGYPVYALAIFFHQRLWAVVSGILLGMTAGLLWTSQGQLMMSYPDRDSVGKFVAIFWGIFNAGGLIGCVMSFVINLPHVAEGPDAVEGSSLSGSTYWTFFIIMLGGCVLSLFVLPLKQVTRVVDGSVEKIIARSNTAPEMDAMALVKQELSRTLSSFKRPQMLLFAPLFFYSNFFYAYHFGKIGVLYNGRTASMVSALYWVAQILGSFILQSFLDSNALSMKRRGYISFFAIFVYMVGSWIFGGYVQYDFEVSSNKQGLDFESQIRNPWASILCLFLWGFVDSFVQVWSYWMMSQISDVPEELACMTAFYKLWQNGGAFLSFLLDAFVPGFEPLQAYWTNVVLILCIVPPTMMAIRSVNKDAQNVAGKDVARTGVADV